MSFLTACVELKNFVMLYRLLSLIAVLGSLIFADVMLGVLLGCTLCPCYCKSGRCP